MPLDHGALLGRERPGLLQDLVGDAHHADVVQVRTELDTPLLRGVQPQQPSEHDGVLRYPLAVAECEAVARFDGFRPRAHDVQVRAFEGRHLPLHVHEIHPRVELAEQAMGLREQPQRFLVPPHRLIEQRQLA